MECPRCGSEKIKLITVSYPKAYECQSCKYVWLKASKALVDE